MKKQLKSGATVSGNPYVAPLVEENSQSLSVDSFITQAIDKGMSVEVMEKLFALREKVMASQAKEAYMKAMAKCQGELPVIEKKKEGGKTNSGAVAYKYAPIEQIVFQVKDIIKENGFSYSFKSETLADKVKVRCTATHILGHSEFSEVEFPNSKGTNIMSAPQVIAATITFGKRYAFCDVFGITVGGEDDDARSAGKGKEEKTIAEWEVGLRKSGDIKQLGLVWAKMPKNLHIELQSVKDEMKEKLSPKVDAFDPMSLKYPEDDNN